MIVQLPPSGLSCTILPFLCITRSRLSQKNLLFCVKTCCTVNDDYICCINAFDNSSVFSELLGQIEADSRESESLEELGGIVFIK